MLPSLTAHDYIALGQIMGVLRRPRNARVDDYKRTIDQLMESLERCGFDTTRAASEVIKAAVIADKEGIITDAAARELSAAVNTIRHALEHESKSREIIVLNTGGVSPKLHHLPTKLTLNNTQQHLLDETIRCVECAAYRGAAVMGWNLAYDYIRRWMWDDPPRCGGIQCQAGGVDEQGNSGLSRPVDRV